MRLIYILLALLFFCTQESALAATKHKAKPKHTTTRTRTVKHVAAMPMIYGSSALASVLSNIIYDTSTKADVAVYVKSMESRDTLFRRNPDTSMTPASTMKIFTAEAALLFLGPQYRFTTQVLTDAQDVKNGVLQGNLYVVLSGDPTLTYQDLVDLMMTLKTQQIQAISGNVYIDNTAYDQRFYGPGWIWEDKDYCYAAPISASIINHNCLSFQISPSAPGQTAQVVRSPKYFYPAIRNSVVTKPKRSRACSVRLSKEFGSTIGLDGCMAAGRYMWGVSYVVADVPEYNRALFKDLLRRLSIGVYGTVTFKSAPQKLMLMGVHASKPLPDLIKEMLKKSDNIIAGALFKKIGQLYSREPGSWENGSLAVSQILSRRAGVNTRGMRILDGSGLSPDNLATPAQMIQVLDFAYHHSATSTDFMNALPIAGVDGTLKHRLGNVTRRVRAKTGTISGVVSLAGYATTSDKETLAFVIMVNGSKGMGWQYKSMEDKIVTALTRYKR